MGSAAKQSGKEEWLLFLLHPSQSEILLFMGDRNKGDEQTVIKNVPTAQGKKSIQTLHKKSRTFCLVKTKRSTDYENPKIQRSSNRMTYNTGHH